jgi:hypothetical protein
MEDALLGWRFRTAFAALLAVSIYGFWSRHLWRQEIWQAPGSERFLIFLATAVVWFGAWMLWHPAWLAPATFGLVVVYTAVEVGVVPVAAALFFLFGCFALGRLALARLAGDAPAFLVLLTGLGAFLWLAGLMAHFPVNYPMTWLVLLAVPLVANPRQTRTCLRDACALLRPVDLDSRLEYAALALALVPLLAQWLVVLKPEVSTDALSMHLMVPAYIADHHAWSFDFRRFTWAVMPMGGVWGYTIAYLLGGEFAARLLNFALFAALCGFVYGSAHRWTGRPMAFLLAALFAATPVVQLVTGSLFVETFYAALVAGALAAIWRAHETDRPAWLVVCSFLLASAMAVKLLALPFVAIIGVILARELAGIWRRGGWRWTVASVAVFLAVAALPYVYAWHVSGNPIFPFANQWFRSPYYASVMSPDSRFSEPLAWRTPFDATFETHRFWEGQDGSIGFHLLLLAPLVLLAAGRSWKFNERTLVWTAFAGTILGLALRPNVRYLYPAFPLLTLALALVPGAARRWLPAKLLACAALLCLSLNLWFLPSSSWYHKAFCLNPLERGADKNYLAAAAPVRLLVDRLNRRYPGENVLFLETGDIAQLHAEAYTNGWHSYGFMQRVAELRMPEEARELARRLGIRHAIYPDSGAGVPVREAVLKGLIDHCAETEASIGGFRLANLGTCRAMPSAEAPAAGDYDDLDPRISFLGNWSHDTQFAQVANHSVTYSDSLGAKFQFRFRGTAVTWVYTKALNRGVARVFLDGAPQSEVDLYAPDTLWQSRSLFRASGNGVHVLEVQVLNRPNPRSAGNFVDVDKLIVE